MTSAERIKYFYERGNHLCHPSSMIKRSVYKDIGEYNNGYRQLHDYDYWTRLLLKYDIHIINKKFVQFTRKYIIYFNFVQNIYFLFSQKNLQMNFHDKWIKLFLTIIAFLLLFKMKRYLTKFLSMNF